MNAEHGEENVQVKPHAYVHRWVDRIKVKDFGVVRIWDTINTTSQPIKHEHQSQVLTLEVETCSRCGAELKICNP